MIEGPRLIPPHKQRTDRPKSPRSAPLPRPQTVDEARGWGGDGDEEEINPKEVAQPSVPTSAVPLPDLSQPSYYPIPKKCTGRRKKKLFLSAKQRAVAKQKLELLNKDFRPVPFFPAKSLDFSVHEALFRALDIWEFAHLILHGQVRTDLLADLIANYDPPNYCSYVNGIRIRVSRVSLARAIELPLSSKRENGKDFQSANSIQGLLSADGATQFLLDFMSNYIFFEDDMCILPTEVIQAIQFVKEGYAYKVDWATLMWILVEKELLEAPKTGTCRYASHLQYLIKHQHPHVFSKKIEPAFLPDPENEDGVSVSDELNAVEVETKAENSVTFAEEEVDVNVRKIQNLEDLVKVASERHESEIGLTIGESVMAGFYDCKMNEVCHWLEVEKNEFEPCLQRCSSKEFDSMEFDHLTNTDMKQEDNFAVDHSAKFSNTERLTSSDHLQEIENVSIPYAQQFNSLNQAHSQKTVNLDHDSTSCTYFGINGKRKFDEIAVEEDQFDHENQQNGMRSCEPWGILPAFSLDECMDQIQCGLKRAKVLIIEKDQAVANMEMQVQYLSHLIQEKEQLICSLKMAVEEQQKWQMAVREYEHELCLLSQMTLGYKRALKETRGKFSDYRRMHPHEDEFIYKDVPGEGLVLSTREFEKFMLVKEEVKRQELLGTFGSFKQILTKFEECEDHIMMHDRKLGKLVDEMKELKGGTKRSSS